MCLDVDHHYKNKNSHLQSDINYSENINQNFVMEQPIETKLNLKSLCGGSLINIPPVFSPEGE